MSYERRMLNASIAQRLAAAASAGIVAGLGCAHGSGQSAAIDIPKLAEARETESPDLTTPRRAIAEPLIVARETQENCCKGQNDCKGKGNCKVSGANDCKGKNPCKSHGGCRPSTCEGGPVVEQPDPSKACCKGQNQCKGMGNCKTAQNACKGMNPCKGQGGCKSAQCP